MPNFESPIGSKRVNGPMMREFNVPDESGYAQPQYQEPQMVPMDENSLRQFQQRMNNQFSSDSEQDTLKIENEIRQAREARRTGRERLNDAAKRRIDILLGITQLTREFTIEGNVFILRTLKSKETRDAISAAVAYDGTVNGPYEIRRQFLSRSLTHIAGVEAEQFIGSNTLEAKLAFLDELDEAFLSRLYEEYVLLNKESKEKYAIKNSEDAKEVAEDLKK